MRIVRTLIGRDYNAEREVATLIAGSDDPGRTLAHVVETAPSDALRITADHVHEVFASTPAVDPSGTEPTSPTAADAVNTADADPAASATSDPSASTATSRDNMAHTN